MFQGKKIKQSGNGYTYVCVYIFTHAYIPYVHVCLNNEGISVGVEMKGAPSDRLLFP